jgi:hypothetical protein
MEEWLSIAGFEGAYEVSSYGRVRSVGRFVRNSSNGKATVWREGVVIKQQKHKNGYYCATLRKDGKQKTCTVHRLVAKAFLKMVSGDQVNHKNEDKSDNRLINLEWVTAKENTNYGTGIKRRARARERAVERYDLETGETLEFYPSINKATEQGYTHSLICCCCSGTNKSHKGYGWRKAG